ncbi:DNA primase small subunit PriS [Halorussus ruber]|uniref:DNA primase small subunit PriS n=1 Tax=Halorussus ruber TaxID=1126238 RepID=UPI001092137B|nr:DNA primase small subunit PriS [Halorussus ruber]
MEERTRAYLRGRFRDHYRRSELTPPPDPQFREWGYIPWTTGPTTMVRHQSLLELGEVGDFLQRERPRHVYFSAGRYDDPGADDMEEKGWRDSDLVFDIDADHLTGVDPQRDSYGEMLAEGKEEVLNLVDLLEDDFGFSELTVVFSGGRGYHVHVRDEGVRGLNRDERREIVDYIRGEGVNYESIIQKKQRVTTTARVIPNEGGWGQRIHNTLLAFTDELQNRDKDSALKRLESFDRIGGERAEKILEAVYDDYEKIKSGNIEKGGQGIRILIKHLIKETVESQSAAIDEPVTTDLRRLIRLPGSLHGGTGLKVIRIPRDEVEAFDPLSDPVPETFEGNEVAIEVTDPGPVELNDESFTLSDGDVSVPEYVAVFLMARGRAEKGRE